MRRESLKFTRMVIKARNSCCFNGSALNGVMMPKCAARQLDQAFLRTKSQVCTIETPLHMDSHTIIIIITSSLIDMCRLLQPSLYYHHHHHHHDHVHVSPSNCHRGTTCFRFTCPRSGALFHHHGLCTSKPATRLAQKTISSWAVFFCQKGDRNIEDINGRLN